MDILNTYLKVTVDFLFFTYPAKVMILAALSTLVIAIANRFLFSSKFDRSGSNLFGFPTVIAHDHSIVDFAFEWLFILCVYIAVYAGCLVGWSYFIRLHPDFLATSSCYHACPAGLKGGAWI